MARERKDEEAAAARTDEAVAELVLVAALVRRYTNEMDGDLDERVHGRPGRLLRQVRTRLRRVRGDIADIEAMLDQ